MGFQAAFRPILLAEHLRNEFLPTVTSFGHGRVCVRLLERADVTLRAGAPGRLNQVGVNQNAAQALHAKALDETHAAHVRRQVIDFRGAFDGLDGVVLLAQVHRETFRAGYPLVPFGKGFAVNGAYPPIAQIVKVPGERSRDEAARTRNDDWIIVGDPAFDAYFGVPFHDRWSLGASRDVLTLK